MEKEVQNLFETTQLTLQQIADKLETTYKIVWLIIKKSYSDEQRKARKIINYSRSKLGRQNPMFGKTGEEHHNFIGDISDGKGYIMVLKPEWYSGRIGCKHVFKHHVVMCEALGITELPSGFHVHHIDKNTTNNSLSNLALLAAGAHSRLHWLERATTIPKGSRKMQSSEAQGVSRSSEG